MVVGGGRRETVARGSGGTRGKGGEGGRRRRRREEVEGKEYGREIEKKKCGRRNREEEIGRNREDEIEKLDVVKIVGWGVTRDRDRTWLAFLHSAKLETAPFAMGPRRW